jgi:uncharacterized SAM-dependent methyltransferase
MDWKKYENEVFEALSARYRTDFIKKDFRIKGRYSNRQRQIDVYIKETIKGEDFVTIVDCN